MQRFLSTKYTFCVQSQSILYASTWTQMLLVKQLIATAFFVCCSNILFILQHCFSLRSTNVTYLNNITSVLMAQTSTVNNRPFGYWELLLPQWKKTHSDTLFSFFHNKNIKKLSNQFAFTWKGKLLKIFSLVFWINYQN